MADHRPLVAAAGGVELQLQVLAQPRDLVGQQGVDQPPQHGLLGRRLGHIGAALRIQLHDLLVRQPGQHLADPRPADVEDVGGPLLAELGAGMEPVLQDGDAYPMHIVPQEVRPRGHAVYTGWVNAAGPPGLALPCAPSREGLPIGMQLIGAYGSDDQLLDLGAAFEAAQPWTDRWPELAAG